MFLSIKLILVHQLSIFYSLVEKQHVQKTFNIITRMWHTPNATQLAEIAYV